MSGHTCLLCLEVWGQHRWGPHTTYLTVSLHPTYPKPGWLCPQMPPKPAPWNSLQGQVYVRILGLSINPHQNGMGWAELPQATACNLLFPRLILPHTSLVNSLPWVSCAPTCFTDVPGLPGPDHSSPSATTWAVSEDGNLERWGNVSLRAKSRLTCCLI